MPERDGQNLGPWSADDFMATVRNNSVAGADSGLPDEVRFVAGVAKLLRLRLATRGSENDPVRASVFLLHPAAPSRNVTLKRVPMLNNGLTSLTGKIWLVNPAVVVGRSVEINSVSEDDEIFRTVTEDLELGDVPTVIFEPRSTPPDVRAFPRGLNQPEIYASIPLSGLNISLEKVLDEVDHIYNVNLISPEAHSKAGRLWKNQDKWWVVQNAEDLIQLYLHVGLASAFPTCTVRAEQTQATGRLDIEIEESDTADRSLITRHALLELKVLRSYGSTGISESDSETREWVQKGVKQAATYRNERGVRAAALCCFDMRKDDSDLKCFEHVLELAKELAVTLRRWYIYAKSEYYRDALVQDELLDSPQG
jgi:hypothetical protein